MPWNSHQLQPEIPPRYKFISDLQSPKNIDWIYLKVDFGTIEIETHFEKANFAEAFQEEIVGESYVSTKSPQKSFKFFVTKDNRDELIRYLQILIVIEPTLGKTVKEICDLVKLKSSLYFSQQQLKGLNLALAPTTPTTLTTTTSPTPPLTPALKRSRRPNLPVLSQPRPTTPIFGCSTTSPNFFTEGVSCTDSTIKPQPPPPPTSPRLGSTEEG